MERFPLASQTLRGPSIRECQKDGNVMDADSRKQPLRCKKPLTGSIVLVFLCSSSQIEGYETFT